jgi:uncharacterized integral membrane protein
MANTAILEASPTPESYPGETRTRLSGAWTALIVGTMALVVILVFIVQNQQNVELSFLMLHGSLPLAVALLLAVVSGAVLVLGFGGARILQLRRVAKRAHRLAAVQESGT